MAQAKVITSQTDFSAGEVDPTLIRDDANPAAKAGLRQCRNFRILDTKGLSNRFGRSIKFVDGPRTDEVLMAPGQAFQLIFGNGYLRVRNAAGAQVFTSALKGDGVTAIPWTSATVRNIVWDVYQSSIYIFYADGAPANVPQVLTWDGVSQTSTWTLSTFAEFVIGNQKRTLFYRIAPPNITLQPSATTGSVTIMFSSAYLVAGMVGTRIRFVGKQLLITAVSSTTVGTATVEEVLFTGQRPNTTGVDLTVVARIGDVVIGATSGAEGIVTGVENANRFDMQSTNAVNFTIGETIVGPSGSYGIFQSVILTTPYAVSDWDEEVMNIFRGFPVSGFVDQVRLGLCNFPSVPGGIAWSAVGLPTDLDVLATTPDAAIFELVPGKSQVLFVVPGNESSEFVFCDNAVYSIPITPANPLKPGSVGFLKISTAGCHPVQPRSVGNVIVYVNAGGSSIRLVVTTGAYNRANETRDISDLHNHLFTGPIAIAAPTADGPYPEDYIYVLNADGTVVAGKYAVENGDIKAGTMPGWTMASGNGTVNWVSARAANIWFNVTYPGPVTVAELLDPTQYLDAALPYNAVPTALTPPGGKGPLWWLPSGTCAVLDLGTRQLGTYQIDANGFLVPQFFGGENLASAQLVVGQAWTATMEPFIPSPGPGQDSRQRMVKRAISEAMAYVQNSTGFLWQKLYHGPLGPNLPALGDVQGELRVPTYNQDDDATLAPYLREDSYFYRPAGSSYNPRVRIVKDTPGPLIICELATEVTL